MVAKEGKDSEADSDPLSQYWQLKNGMNHVDVQKVQVVQEPHMHHQEEVKHNEIVRDAEPIAMPGVEYCTGCGIKLQVENKSQAGYIDTKLLKRDKQIENIIREDDIPESTQPDQEEKIIEHLKNIGAPDDVLREFMRGSAQQKQPEILDVDALIGLDQF